MRYIFVYWVDTSMIITPNRTLSVGKIHTYNSFSGITDYVSNLYPSTIVIIWSKNILNLILKSYDDVPIKFLTKKICVILN